MKNNLIILATLVLSFIPMLGQSSFTLEQTLNGHYTPYNINIVSPGEDPILFPSPVLSSNENTLSLKILDENFDVYETVKITLPVHQGYKANYGYASPRWILPNGERFFLIYYLATNTIDYGIENRYISEIISEEGVSLYSIKSDYPLDFDRWLYIINGKCYAIAYTTMGVSRTYIFSLGILSSSSLAPSTIPFPVISFDINGRILTEPEPGIVTITTLSDGTVIKNINK